MELIRISDSKLKVMLSAEDMAHYELNCETIDSVNSPSRRAFWNILDEAKRQTGFDPAGERVFVQLYPERGGGCEMFVTKLGIRSTQPYVTHSETAGEPYIRAQTSHAARERIYIFTALADLLSACRRMRDTDAVTVSRAYVNEDRDTFYLTVDRDLPFLTEYNAVPGGRRELYYIEEHCRCFCRDAAASLGALA